ncbi:MAG: histidinol dehydrogenase [Dehalococcoidia bacterium]|nr:histidinol dehydrogenase [Dehalococcoidia bacterium]
MRVYRGFEAAREAIARRVPLEETEVPAAVQRRLAQVFGVEISPVQAVSRILADLRETGDRALAHYTASIDGVELASVEVERRAIEEAYANLPAATCDALHVAAERIRSFHQVGVPRTWVDFESGLGQMVRPLERVGLYVPGGRAAYPSTVLMTAIPAKVAGVPEVAVATPPDRQGNANTLVLAAAKIAGVDRVFKMGGAQAIGALAYGTASVPRVDKICGPGNIFVVLAKRAVFGTVAIDGLHGPSEAVAIVDESADPVLCAADLLAQAEHDELATAVLITTSDDLLERILAKVEEQLATLERAEIIRGSLERNGFCAVVDTLSQAASLANQIAPEHLSVMVRDGWGLLAEIHHTGAVFLGSASSAALGDYVAGPSHVMPTGGTARFSSPLRTEDFVKVTSLVAVDLETAKVLGTTGAAIARAEGLTAHARALEARLLL